MHSHNDIAMPTAASKQISLLKSRDTMEEQHKHTIATI